MKKAGYLSKLCKYPAFYCVFSIYKLVKIIYTNGGVVRQAHNTSYSF